MFWEGERFMEVQKRKLEINLKTIVIEKHTLIFYIMTIKSEKLESYNILQ